MFPGGRSQHGPEITIWVCDFQAGIAAPGPAASVMVTSGGRVSTPAESLQMQVNTRVCVLGGGGQEGHCKLQVTLSILDKSANLVFCISRTFCRPPFILHKNSLKPTIIITRKNNPNKF